MVAERCTAFPTAMNDDSGVCRGRCLAELGKPEDDVIDSPGTLSFNNVTVDAVTVP